MASRIVRRTRTELCGISGGKLTVEYDNVGEPYREGILVSLISSDDPATYAENCVGVLLDHQDACYLRDMLNQFIGKVENGRNANAVRPR